MGFYLQVNLLSLTGYYGKPAAKAARYIMQNGLADFVGSDLHHDRHLAMLQNADNLKIFDSYLGGKNYNDFTSL